MSDTLQYPQQSQAMGIHDPAIVAAAESVKAQIQASYMVALSRPRNMDQARTRILANCKRPMFAERVEYNKPIGKGIKGPSIRFAELAIREWGNIRIDTQVIFEDDFYRRTKVTVIDLESNSSFSKDVQVAKTVERKSKKDREVLGERLNSYNETVYIVKATDDEIHNKEAAMISKVIRNEGLRLIPSDIIDEAIETARDTLTRRDKEDPDASRKRLLDAFVEIGVEPKDIETYLGHSTKMLQPSELADLRGIYRAIKDGDAKWSDYLEKDQTESTNGAAKKTAASAESLKDQLKKAATKKAEHPVTPETTGGQGESELDPGPFAKEWATAQATGDAALIAAVKSAIQSGDEQAVFDALK